MGLCIVQERNHPTERTIGYTFVRDVRGKCWIISTVLLPHALGTRDYETMVFPTTKYNRDDWDGLEVYCDRYDSPEDAQIGHFTALGMTIMGNFQKED